MTKSHFLIKLLILLVVVLPIKASAQDTPHYTVGVLLYDVPTLITEMATLGYVEGENITYIFPDYTDAGLEQFAERYETAVQQMIDSNADVIVVLNDTDATFLRQRTTIPIVFSISDNPVVTGAVADLTAPGGLTTGVVSNQHHTRRLQLLKEVNPDTKKVYYLYSSNAIEGLDVLAQVTELGEELGIEIVPAPVADLATGLEALAATPEDADWIFLTPFLPFDLEFGEALVSTSTTLNVPIAGFLAIPSPGYLVNYGPDLIMIVQQAAEIADQILRGANPAELPVVIAENSFIINLEVAQALGMEIPVAILRQADSIVRPSES